MKTNIQIKKSFLEGQIPSKSSEECVILSHTLEKIRKDQIKQASWVFENNLYFPDYCISDMLKMEKCISYSQIIQDEHENLSIDKPNFTICLKSKNLYRHDCALSIRRT